MVDGVHSIRKDDSIDAESKTSRGLEHFAYKAAVLISRCGERRGKLLRVLRTATGKAVCSIEP